MRTENSDRDGSTVHLHRSRKEYVEEKLGREKMEAVRQKSALQNWRRKRIERAVVRIGEFKFCLLC